MLSTATDVGGRSLGASGHKGARTARIRRWTGAGALGADGALYLSDDKAGQIYRISYVG